MLRISVVSSLLLAVACGGTAKKVSAPVPINIEEAGLPFHILRATTGREVERATFFEELRSAQAVCVGESHNNSHHHWAQLEVLKVIAQEGTEFAIGMEMFQRPFQGVLDDFTEGKIDEAMMLARTDWKKRWTYDWDYYAPMVRFTIASGGRVVALNVSKELKDKWKASGLEGLSSEERAQLPELDMADAQHRTWFRTLMEEMSEKHGSGENNADAGGHALIGDDVEPPEDFIDKIYPVQVLWDETMADTATKWLMAQSDRRLVILAGHGHCHESAIIRRMRRRGIVSVISVRPVVDMGKGEVADLLTAPVNSFLFVMKGQE